MKFVGVYGGFADWLVELGKTEGSGMPQAAQAVVLALLGPSPANDQYLEVWVDRSDTGLVVTVRSAPEKLGKKKKG